MTGVYGAQRKLAIVMISFFRTHSVLTCLSAFAYVRPFSSYLWSTSSVPGTRHSSKCRERAEHRAKHRLHISVSSPEKTSPRNFGHYLQTFRRVWRAALDTSTSKAAIFASDIFLNTIKHDSCKRLPVCLLCACSSSLLRGKLLHTFGVSHS